MAPRPVPTMTAIGVASPSASGQAITKTVMVKVTANSSGWPIHQNQTAKVSKTDDDRGKHQPLRGPVGQQLRRRLGVLRLLHQLDDLRQRGVGADLGRACSGSVPLLLMVAPITVSPGSFLTGIDSPVSIDSSTCELALDHPAVDRNLVAWPDHDDVAHQDLGRRNLDLAAIANDSGLRRREIHQRPDRVGRAGARAHLQPVAEQDEDEQDGRRPRRTARPSKKKVAPTLKR